VYFNFNTRENSVPEIKVAKNTYMPRNKGFREARFNKEKI
jgi:hypothetical protein